MKKHKPLKMKISRRLLDLNDRLSVMTANRLERELESFDVYHITRMLCFELWGWG